MQNASTSNAQVDIEMERMCGVRGAVNPQLEAMFQPRTPVPLPTSWDTSEVDYGEKFNGCELAHSRTVRVLEAIFWVSLFLVIFGLAMATPGTYQDVVGITTAR